MDKRDFIGVVEASEPLLKEAFDALRAYHEALDAGRPAEEVERLKLVAEYLFQTVCDYQMRVINKVLGRGGGASALIAPVSHCRRAFDFQSLQDCRGECYELFICVGLCR
ncbi:hypothetical protein [Pseudomonas mosselii]|uniref:hypothetical protein n=1 Tax=Pseudomonas mosselii TaxID=78327 RepID=UPI003C7AEC17